MWTKGFWIRRKGTKHWQEFAAAIGLPERATATANGLALKAAAAVSLVPLPFTGSPLNRALREIRLPRNELET